MKLKKVSLLLIFIFSIVLTNIFYSRNLPPLFEHRNNQNIIILADTASNSPEIVPFEISINDNTHIVEQLRDVIPNFIGVVSIVMMSIKNEKKSFSFKKERGLTGIIIWDRKRVLLN